METYSVFIPSLYFLGRREKQGVTELFNFGGYARHEGYFGKANVAFLVRLAICNFWWRSCFL